MKIVTTPLPGVVLLEPRVFRDDRGFFLESFSAPRFAEHGLPSEFPQDNQARSTRGVLRGLHYQLEQPQGKLLTVIRGEVYDVILDIRRGSPTFGKWWSVVLSGDSPRFIYIPPGYAHGYCVLSAEVDFIYKVTALYAPHDQRGVLWSDPGLAIPWPVKDPILSEKDQQYLPLHPSRTDLPSYTP